MGTRHLVVLGCSVAVVCGVASAQEPPPVGPAPSSSAAFPDTAPDAAPPEQPSAEPAPSASAAPEPVPSATPEPAPAPSPPPVTPAPVAPPSIAPQPSAAAAPAYGMAYTQTPPRAPRSGLVGGLRFGFLLTGSGSLDPKCSGQCNSFPTSGTDFDDASKFFFGGDLMYHVSPSVRLGAAALYFPSTSIEASGYSSEDSMGEDISMMAAVEGVFDTGPKTAVAVRGQTGLMLLFPGGDLQSSIDQLKEVCTQGSTDVCTVNDGPYPGFTFGVGPGLIFGLEKAALRVDLWFQWYTVPNLLRTKGSAGVTDVDVSYTWTGTRVLLSGGLEF